MLTLHRLLIVAAFLGVASFCCLAVDPKWQPSPPRIGKIAVGTARSGEAPLAFPKPYLIVEAWYDRDYCSDLYAFDFDGKLLRRLTHRPLPSCSLEAVSADGSEVTFVANASTFYSLSERSDFFVPLHDGNVSAVAISPSGKGVAYVTGRFEKDAVRALHVQPLVAGAPFERIEIQLKALTSELKFAPDGKKLLLTVWAGGPAAIHCCDLESRKIEPWISDPAFSFFEPTFAPDGKSVAAIRESLDTGECAIVSKAWPTGEITVLRTGPHGASMSSPIFCADGKHLLFVENGVLARMAADGGEAEGLSGEMDNRPRQAIPPGARCRRLPMRPSSMPLVVGRWISCIDYEKPDGRLVIIDVQTKEKKIVPLPNGKLMRAVVVE